MLVRGMRRRSVPDSFSCWSGGSHVPRSRVWKPQGKSGAFAFFLLKNVLANSYMFELVDFLGFITWIFESFQ